MPIEPLEGYTYPVWYGSNLHNCVGKTGVCVPRSAFVSWSKEFGICVFCFFFSPAGEFCCMHDCHPAANGWQPLHPLYQHFQNQTRHHCKLSSLGPGNLKSYYIRQNNNKKTWVSWAQGSPHPPLVFCSYLQWWLKRKKHCFLLSVGDKIWRRAHCIPGGPHSTSWVSWI